MAHNYISSLFFRKELLEATYVENEIAFARSQGAFTLPNPLAVVKDEGEHITYNTILLRAYYFKISYIISIPKLIISTELAASIYITL